MMQVNGLNHVNIVAADLEATLRFYESVLGMKAQPIPNVPASFSGRWICDCEGAPIIHVQPHNPERHGALAQETPTTGAIDHVALACADFAGMLRRCEQLEVPHRVNDGKYGVRQVFVTDPNNVLLELNFPRE